jgi:hypothetical protein
MTVRIAPGAGRSGARGRFRQALDQAIGQLLFANTPARASDDGI